VALVESLSLEIGQLMPDFALSDPEGKSYTRQALAGKKGLLIAFTCNHCPYAVAIWPRLIRLAAWAEEEGVATVAINPNIHPDYPDDSPDRMLDKIRQWGILFPYLVDASQSVARAYQAQCTPDLYLLDQHYRLFYHGRLDDNWKSESDVSRKELQMAIHAMVEGEPSPAAQQSSMGCSIKWQ
jgi:peroxiredoxin